MRFERLRRNRPGTDCMLRGAAIFTGDLVRSISVPLTLDFMAISSYAQRAEFGAVKFSRTWKKASKGGR